MSNFSEFKVYISTYLSQTLSKDLLYHGWHHTMEVYRNAIEIARAEKIGAANLRLLKVAVLLHDAGFVKVYDGHEEEGCKMAKRLLPKYDFTKDEISVICGMIMATKIPQCPKTNLEQIIADADLMYLGTDQFESIGATLLQERNIYFAKTDQGGWDNIQINFLDNHKFHTSYCHINYEPQKLLNMKELIKKTKRKIKKM